MSTSAARPLSLEPAQPRALPRRPDSAPPREAFTLPEPARDAPGMDRRPEPTRARPETARRQDEPQRPDRPAGGEKPEQPRSSRASDASGPKGEAAGAGNGAEESATPVDSAFAAQQVAGEAAAAVAAEAELAAEDAAMVEETEAAQDGEDATSASAEPVKTSSSAVVLAPPAAMSPAIPAEAADGETVEAASEVAPVASGKPDGKEPGKTGQDEQVETEAARPPTSKPESAPRKPEAEAPAGEPGASSTSPSRPAKEMPAKAADHAAAPETAEAKPEAAPGDKAAPQALEARASAATEALGRLEQALQPAIPPQRPAETLPQADKPQSLPEPARPLPPSAVPVEIGLRALQGLKEFQIRLDPAELGRVEVRLEIGEDKSVSAKVVVDRVETLHLLQRDARTLERAFEQAGLKSSDAGIDITLRDPGQQRRDGRGEAWEGEGAFADGRPRAERQPDVQPIMIRRVVHAGALDLSV